MSRLDMIQEHNNEINKIISDLDAPKDSKVVIWDYDSMLHHCLYSGKDEFGNKNPEYTEEDLEYLQGKLTEMTLKVLNNIEKYYNILSCYIFIKGDKTFRKELYSEYKSKRSAPNPLINKLYDYAIIAHQAIPSGNKEAEDMVFEVSKKIDNNGIIVYVDHDLLEIPSVFYNYQKDKWSKVTEKEAKWNEYKKYVLGEQGDGVNLCKGVGQKFFEATFNIDMTDEQYEEGLLKCFMKAYKNNEELAIQNINLSKKLLGLKYANNE